MLQSAAALIEKILNCPGEETAHKERADGEGNRTNHPGGEQDKLIYHLTTSLCGPDEICTSAGRRRSGTAARPGTGAAVGRPGRRRGYG